MGQTSASPDLGAAEQKVVSARRTVDRIVMSYDQLVQAITQDDANKAYGQAIDSLNAAQKNYSDLLAQANAT